jgi:hypothetical protein
VFAKVVPRELVGPKVGKLIERARDKIWDDPEGAMKEVEELAESFGHPDYYRAVLRFYDVRNVTGIAALKRAQRLWELTGDSEDPLLWQMLKKNYTVNPRFPGAEWLPSADFVESVWRGAGAKDPEFAQLLAQTYSVENEDSRAADILLETMKAYEPTAPLASNCILYLNYARREDEAEGLVLRFIPAFGNDPQFVDAWARLAAAARNDRAVLAMINHPAMNIVRERHPAIGAQLLMLTGMDKEASALADLALRRAGTGRGEINTSELGEVFSQLGRWPEFEEAMRGKISQRNLDELRKRLSVRRPARRILNAHGEES